MPKFNVSRGEIYFISLDPAFGHELAGFKMRPVAVMSVNSLHFNTQIAIVIPGTSKTSDSPFPNQVVLKASDVRIVSGKLFEPTSFQCHQMRSVSVGRFTQRAIGRLSEAAMVRLEDAVRYCLGISPEQ